MKVLIVDDNNVVASLIKDILANENHTTKTANNGQDGYLAFQSFSPDLVITDIQMPIKDGFELIDNIRQHDMKIKTIYMSGNPSLFKLRLEREKKTYNSCFLEKPFSLSDLKSLISKSLAANS